MISVDWAGALDSATIETLRQNAQEARGEAQGRNGYADMGEVLRTPQRGAERVWLIVEVDSE